jgi:putative MATE family efflux protein
LNDRLPSEEPEVEGDGDGASAPPARTPLQPDDPPSEGMVIAEEEAAVEAEGFIRSGKLAGRTMWAAIWILAAPVLLQQTMQACVGLVDQMLAGSLPATIVKPALDGIGVGSYLGWFIGIAMSGLGIGGQAIIARAMGAGDRALAHRTLGQIMMLSVIWSVLVGVFMWFIVDALSAYSRLSPEATVFCREYVRIVALSLPFCGVMMVGSMCLYGAGETTRPSAIAIGVNIVNIVFSWLLCGADLRYSGFELENPFHFDLNVIGIAAGTAIAYVFGAAMTLWVLFHGVKDLRLEARELTMSHHMTWRIVRIGMPTFFEGISMWAVNLFVLSFIGMIAVAESTTGGPGAARGAEGYIGAHTITVRWESFSFLPGFAIGTAAGALAGQYLGARNPRMAKQAIIVCTLLAVAFMSALGLVFMFAGGVLTTLVSRDPVHLEHVPPLLFICGTVQCFFAVLLVVRQGLQGVGDTRWTFFITTASSYGIRLPAAYILGVRMELGLEGIWIALCGEFSIRAALFSARFLHGGWQRLRV